MAVAGKPVLVHRTEGFVELILLIGGIMAAATIVQTASARWTLGDVGRVATVIGGAFVFVLGQAYVDTVASAAPTVSAETAHEPHP